MCSPHIPAIKHINATPFTTVGFWASDGQDQGSHVPAEGTVLHIC